MVILITAALALIFLGIGRLCNAIADRRIDGGMAASAYHLIAGWALLSLVAVVIAILGTHLSIPFFALCAIGIVGLVLAPRHLAGAAYLAGACALALPLLWIASKVAPTMFDEFAQWLPNARFLIEQDRFADAAHPNVWTAKPGYPPALTLISYGVHRLGSSAFEIAPKVFNVIVAAAFGLVLAAAVSLRVGPALALAAGVAGATILNPFFDPRMALAVYADVPSAFVLAMCVAAYWRAASEPDGGAWWRMAAPTVVVLLLRETGIVLAAGIGLGLLLLLGRRSWRGFGVLALTSVAAFIGWRLYLWSAGLPSGLTPRPMAEWDWNAPWTVVRTLGTDRLANNRLIGAVTIVVASVAAVAAVIGVLRAKDSRIRDLIVICVAVAVVWIAFLAWSYMAAFSPGEVATAASAWRYISELGPTFIFACFAAVGAALPAAADLEPRARIRLRWIGAVACVLVPASLLATWKYWRFDCRYADIVALRTIVAPLKTAGVGDQPMAIVHPTDAFGYAITLDYELHRPMGTSLGVATAEGASQPFRLDVRQIDRSALARNGMRPPVILMRRERDGWTTVLAIPSAPLPACTLAE